MLKEWWSEGGREVERRWRGELKRWEGSDVNEERGKDELLRDCDDMERSEGMEI